MSNSNFASLFNMNNSVVEEPQAVRNTDEYKVSFKSGKGGVYESVVRFVPFYANPEKCIISKTVDFVKNPFTQRGIYVDDPRTVGNFSPVIDMFFKFYNSGSNAFKEFGKNHLSSKPTYASLVQIIKDDQHPELVGQIKVFKYGKKLWDKLYAEEHPAMGQGVNPFHPVYGRYFYIKCTGQSGFNNFDQSNFFDNKNAQNQVLPMGIWYKKPGSDKFEVVNENSDQQAVFEYLQANSPDLANYDYQPWTSEQDKFVNDVLAICAEYLRTGNLQANLQEVNTIPAAVPGLQMNQNPVFPGASVPAAPVAPAVGIPTPPPAAMPQAPVTPAPSMGAFSMGQLDNVVSPAQGTISGIDIPTVEPVEQHQGAVPNMGGIIGNVDDVLANL